MLPLYKVRLQLVPWYWYLLAQVHYALLMKLITNDKIFKSRYFGSLERS